MSDNLSNSKRLAKNTLMLYFRMILIMVVNLYASRVILKVLGADDYGTYNVVGGVVMMLSFIMSSLSGATSRFITFELGKGEQGDTTRMFRSFATIFYILSIIVVLLAETIGLWFVQTKLNIPKGREFAALCVYQCSVATFVISLISITYNALIIAHERMNAFAYISIFEAFAKLSILYLISILPFDSLILYAVLLMVVQLLIRFIYTIYCKKKFNESDGRWLWDKNISKQIFSYTGWTLGGHFAVVGYTQGINILLNIYFGPAVNAARAIASQVQGALSQLYGNFQTAVRPQIIKNYAQGDLETMHRLVLVSGRISYLLAILASIPVFAFADYILQIWLVTPPDHLTAFLRLTLVVGACSSLSHHTLIAIHATGNIKTFQIIESSCLLLVLPIAWYLLKFHNVSSETVILVYVIIEFITQFVRVAIVYPRVKLPIMRFIKDIFVRCLFTTLLCAIPAYLLCVYYYPTDMLSLIFDSFILLVAEIIAIYVVGITASERQFVKLKLFKNIIA